MLTLSGKSCGPTVRMLPTRFVAFFESSCLGPADSCQLSASVRRKPWLRRVKSLRLSGSFCLPEFFEQRLPGTPLPFRRNQVFRSSAARLESFVEA
jgi:hypothetical protein